LHPAHRVAILGRIFQFEPPQQRLGQGRFAFSSNRDLTRGTEAVAKGATADGSRHVCLFHLSSATHAAGGCIATFFPFRSAPGCAPERGRHDRIQFNTRPLDAVRVTPLQLEFSRHQRREYPPAAGRVAHSNVQTRGGILIVGRFFGSGTTDSDCSRLPVQAGAPKRWAAKTCCRPRAGSRCLELGFAESGLTVPTAG
jgi:hypothetical protein